jgi:TRAP-type uncharacterized transport system fused permease subunit
MSKKATREDWMMLIGIILIVGVIFDSLYHPIRSANVDALFGRAIIEGTYKLKGPLIGWLQLTWQYAPQRIFSLLIGITLIILSAYWKSRYKKNGRLR